MTVGWCNINKYIKIKIKTNKQNKTKQKQTKTKTKQNKNKQKQKQNKTKNKNKQATNKHTKNINNKLPPATTGTKLTTNKKTK